MFLIKSSNFLLNSSYYVWINDWPVLVLIFLSHLYPFDVNPCKLYFFPSILFLLVTALLFWLLLAVCTYCQILHCTTDCCCKPVERNKTFPRQPAPKQLPHQWVELNLRHHRQWFLLDVSNFAGGVQIRIWK